MKGSVNHKKKLGIGYKKEMRVNNDCETFCDGEVGRWRLQGEAFVLLLKFLLPNAEDG